MRPPLRFIFCFALFAVGPCSSSAEAQTAVGKTENVVVVAQDGSGDFNGKDDAPIRAAMESFGDSGGVILVREGTYTIRKTIRLRSNVTLRGTNQPTFGLPGPLLIEHDAPAGSRTLRLFANHGFQAGDELQLLPPGEGKEDPLTLSVDRAEPGLIHLSKELPRAFPQLSRLGYQHKMILGYGVTNVVLENLLIDGGRRKDVVMPGHHLRSAIWFSARYSYDEGPIAPPSSNIAVRHCTIMNCYGRAVAFYHTTDSEVVGCRISAINDEAIDFDHFARRCRAIGNWIDGATIGLELNDASHCVVRHNTIQRVRIGAKIWWYSKIDPEGLNEHNVIEHNTIGPVEEKAIFIGRNCHNNRVAHNFLSGDVSVVEASNIVVDNSR